jgi:hypothetical protein
MKHFASWKKVRLGTLISLAATSACSGPILQPVASRPEKASPGISTFAAVLTNEPAGKQSDALGDTPAIRIYIDPQTGEITTPPRSPAPMQPPKQSPDAVKESAPELYETLSPIPGGGVMIDLKDQFQSPLTATLDGNGEVSIKHQSEVPVRHERK